MHRTVVLAALAAVALGATIDLAVLEKERKEGLVTWTLDVDPVRAYFAEEFPLLKDALGRWGNRQTCLKFRKCLLPACRVPDITFVEGDRCELTKHADGRATIVFLESCSKNRLSELIGSAMGLGQEHLRRDRDEFVHIPEASVREGLLRKKESLVAVGEYDYGSITHEGPRVGVEEGVAEPNMVAPGHVGQRWQPSEGDKEAVRLLHGGMCTELPDLRVTASRDVNKVHRIPQDTQWEVEFLALLHPGAPASAVIDVTHVAEGPLEVRVEDAAAGRVLRGAAWVRGTVAVPRGQEAGTQGAVTVTFRSGEEERNATVRYEVAGSNVVCFGKAGDDDGVCGGRGTCQAGGYCQCPDADTYRDPMCAGTPTCPANAYFDFKDGAGVWMTEGPASTHKYYGKGYLSILNSAWLTLARPSKPRRVTFLLRRWVREGRTQVTGPVVRFESVSGRTCFSFSFPTEQWHQEAYGLFMDVRPRWEGEGAGTVDVFAGSRTLIRGQEMDPACRGPGGEGVLKVLIEGTGTIGAFGLWCGGYVLPSGLPFERATWEELSSGGGQVELEVVGPPEVRWSPLAAGQVLRGSLRLIRSAARLLFTDPATATSADGGRRLVVGPLQKVSRADAENKTKVSYLDLGPQLFQVEGGNNRLRPKEEHLENMAAIYVTGKCPQLVRIPFEDNSTDTRFLRNDGECRFAEGGRGLEVGRTQACFLETEMLMMQPMWTAFQVFLPPGEGGSTLTASFQTDKGELEMVFAATTTDRTIGVPEGRWVTVEVLFVWGESPEARLVLQGEPQTERFELAAESTEMKRLSFFSSGSGSKPVLVDDVELSCDPWLPRTPQPTPAPPTPAPPLGPLPFPQTPVLQLRLTMAFDLDRYMGNAFGAIPKIFGNVLDKKFGVLSARMSFLLACRDSLNECYDRQKQRNGLRQRDATALEAMQGEWTFLYSLRSRNNAPDHIEEMLAELRRYESSWAVALGAAEETPLSIAIWEAAPIPAPSDAPAVTPVTEPPATGPSTSPEPVAPRASSSSSSSSSLSSGIIALIVVLSLVGAVVLVGATVYCYRRSSSRPQNKSFSKELPATDPHVGGAVV